MTCQEWLVMFETNGSPTNSEMMAMMCHHRACPSCQALCRAAFEEGSRTLPPEIQTHLKMLAIQQWLGLALASKLDPELGGGP